MKLPWVNHKWKFTGTTSLPLNLIFKVSRAGPQLASLPLSLLACPPAKPALLIFEMIYQVHSRTTRMPPTVSRLIHAPPIRRG